MSLSVPPLLPQRLHSLTKERKHRCVKKAALEDMVKLLQELSKFQLNVITITMFASELIPGEDENHLCHGRETVGG